MKEGTGDIDNVQTIEDAVVERNSGSLRRKTSSSEDVGRLEEVVVETPASVESEGESNLEEALPERAAVVEGQVMGRLTIRELEMMPKLEEIPVGGVTNIEAEVIGAIAGVAAQSVEGVDSLGTTSLRRTFRERMGGAERRARGVEVEVGRREVIVDIGLKVIYGYSIPMTVIKVRQIVADRLLRLCGLVTKEINIRVTGLEFPTRMPGSVQ